MQEDVEYHIKVFREVMESLYMRDSRCSYRRMMYNVMYSFRRLLWRK
jgi:hypothetical protein